MVELPKLRAIADIDDELPKGTSEYYPELVKELEVIDTPLCPADSVTASVIRRAQIHAVPRLSGESACPRCGAHSTARETRGPECPLDTANWRLCPKADC